MTLRVTLEIVPFGEEENKHTIGTINISNLGPDNAYECHLYHVHELPVAKPIRHVREHGAWWLVRRVLNEHMDRLTEDLS